MAFPGTYNFSYYRGDTNEFVVRPKNSTDGSSFNLTGYTAEFVVATARGSSGIQYPMTAVVNDVSDIVTCTIEPADGRDLTPGSFVYDVQITNGIEIYTILTGTISVTDDISGA
jgi:hypothetical protein